MLLPLRVSLLKEAGRKATCPTRTYGPCLLVSVPGAPGRLTRVCVRCRSVRYSHCTPPHKVPTNPRTCAGRATRRRLAPDLVVRQVRQTRAAHARRRHRTVRRAHPPRARAAPRRTAHQAANPPTNRLARYRRRPPTLAARLVPERAPARASDGAGRARPPPSRTPPATSTCRRPLTAPSCSARPSRPTSVASAGSLSPPALAACADESRREASQEQGGCPRKPGPLSHERLPQPRLRPRAGVAPCISPLPTSPPRRTALTAPPAGPRRVRRRARRARRPTRR